jgi:predicted RNA binding protein YcfA (HicA-like mRNA interferase family)
VPTKVRDMIKIIEREGWYYVRTTGSHRHYKHAERPGIVTIAGKPSSDIPIGTERNVRKQAGL